MSTKSLKLQSRNCKAPQNTAENTRRKGRTVGDVAGIREFPPYQKKREQVNSADFHRKLRSLQRTNQSQQKLLRILTGVLRTPKIKPEPTEDPQLSGSSCKHQKNQRGKHMMIMSAESLGTLESRIQNEYKI